MQYLFSMNIGSLKNKPAFATAAGQNIQSIDPASASFVFCPYLELDTHLGISITCAIFHFHRYLIAMVLTAGKIAS